jgi:hypothetical protein
MMKKIDLNFSYKGDRQYIQGPDIFNQCFRVLMEQTLDEVGNLEFAIHKMTDSNLTLMLYQKQQAPEVDSRDIAILKFSSCGRLWQANLINADTKPVDRVPYDENSIIELCEIDADARWIILKSGEAPYSDMETLVSMNKALHMKLFPQLQGSWVFCRWESPRWPLEGGMKSVCVRIVQTLGTRLTKSEVSFEGEVLGYIYFSARNNQ